MDLGHLIHVAGTALEVGILLIAGGTAILMAYTLISEVPTFVSVVGSADSHAQHELASSAEIVFGSGTLFLVSSASCRSAMERLRDPVLGTRRAMVRAR